MSTTNGTASALEVAPQCSFFANMWLKKEPDSRSSGLFGIIMRDGYDFHSEISRAAAKDIVGFAAIDASRIVADRLGSLSLWLPDVGKNCCESLLLTGLESEFDALANGERDSIVLPSIRGISLDIRSSVTTTIIWNAQSSRFFVMTAPDPVLRQIECLLGDEHRARRIAEEQLAALDAEARFATVARERLRLARDLHDTLAHSIVALLTQIRLVRHVLTSDSQKAEDELSKAETAAIQGLARVRKTIASIRSPESEHQDPWQEIEIAAQSLRERTGARVVVEIEDDARSAGHDYAHVIQRVIVEALRNVERHAGADSILISAQYYNRDPQKRLTVSVFDNGIGFDQTRRHPDQFGIVGMKELAALAGGRCELESAPGVGTTMRLTIPIRFPHRGSDTPAIEHT